MKTIEVLLWEWAIGGIKNFASAKKTPPQNLK
jgi:hypothetical protein